MGFPRYGEGRFTSSAKASSVSHPPSKSPAPCGAWKSPITAETVTKATAGLGFPWIDGDAVYWTESRPWEKGRTCLMRWTEQAGAAEVSGADHNIRTRVHEYGGRAYVAAGGTAWYTNLSDGRIHAVGGSGATAVTRRDGTEYADFTPDPARNRLIAVAERQRVDAEPLNLLVAIGLDGTVSTLAEGADFYAAPRISPDGSRLAWIEWNHPNMPWDGSLCREATLSPEGTLATVRIVAGGETESVFQPEYAPDGTLYYVSDKSGYWNLYRDGDPPAQFRAAADFGLPHWQFGMRTYAILDPRTAVTSFAVDGDWRLALFDLETGKATPLDLPWVSFDGIVGGGRRVVFTGGRPDGPPEIVQLVFGDPNPERVLKRASDTAPDPADVSAAEKIDFMSADGTQAHAYYYPPTNARFSVPEGERPPLIVMGHGGPTGQATRTYSTKVQFWTSRGFAVADVNYGGSTGFGRAYRQRLDGAWGVVDVDDCCAAAAYLAARGDVDPERLIIVGGSAGGYTTLSALAFRSVFKAGRSSYGIGDLEALARDTHKFESRYLDRLIGPWPDAKAVYEARSPLRHLDGFDCPVLFLQGADDKVVPPNQAEMMVDALRDKGLPVAYLLFEGEGHGFRAAEAIQAALHAELSFYGQIFGFTPADDIPAIAIENLNRS
jgi:dipeptidyl aminopeptidase/acylaminoacyl peptidase